MAKTQNTKSKNNETSIPQEKFNSIEENQKLNHQTKSTWYKAFCEIWFIKQIQIIFLVCIVIILINTGLDISFGKAENSTWFKISINIITFLVGWLIPKNEK